jgi:ATP-dependent Clp protease ATP-binding subunit ClpA
LEITDAARDLIATEGFDPSFGARPLKRAMQRLLLNPLSTAVIEGQYAEGDSVIVDRAPDSERLTFQRGAGAARAVD